MRTLGGGPGGLDMRLLVSADDTRGAFEIIEDRRPGGRGPAPHVHRERDEAFYVLEGRFRLVRGTDVLEVGPGETAVAPRGTRHAYVALDDPSRLLFIVAPAGIAGFMDESGALIATGLTPAEAMARLEGRYDVTLAPEEG